MWVQFTSPRSLDQWIRRFLTTSCSLQLVNSFIIQWNHLAYKDTFCCNEVRNPRMQKRKFTNNLLCWRPHFMPFTKCMDEFGELVPLLLLIHTLNLQVSYFKMTMGHNYEQVLWKDFFNPFTSLRCKVFGPPIFNNKLLEFIKIAKIIVVKVIGFIENEQTFSTISFMKNKLLLIQIIIFKLFFTKFNHIFSHVKQWKKIDVVKTN
jgi:hypothetical protein